jgi:hypothetical protein
MTTSASTAARGDFGDERCCTCLLGPGTEALDDAKGNKEDRPEHPGLFEGGKEPDREAGHAHQADGEDQDHFAAEPVTDVAEDDAAEGPGCKPHSIGGKGGDHSPALAERRKEERSEDQCGSKAVDIEVVILQCRPYGTCKSCPPQLVRIDGGTFSGVRCISTSCHKNSLITRQAPVGLVDQRQHQTMLITMLNRVQ